MAAALFLIIFIPLFYFLFTVQTRATANIVFLTGECSIIRNGKTLSAKIGDKTFGIPVLYVTELLALAFGENPDELGVKFHRSRLTALLQKLGLK